MNKFIEFLESQVNKAIYVWGAQGQTATNALIDKSRNTSSNKRYARALLAKRIAEGKTDIKAFDCSGLGNYYIENIKGWSGDRSSRGMYSDCEHIKRSELKKGDWVFRYSYSSFRVVHVGYVVDDSLNVIEDKSSKSGVIKSSLDSSKWNRYGRPPYYESEEEDMVQKGDKGINVTMWQNDLIFEGFTLPKYGVDGNFGTETATATKAFQKSVELSQSGIVDALTLLKMVDARATNATKVKVLEAKISKAILALK